MNLKLKDDVELILIDIIVGQIKKKSIIGCWSIPAQLIIVRSIFDTSIPAVIQTSPENQTERFLWDIITRGK